ncbi:MAG: YafY family protein [Candidatus Zixiibacteriota bacterium]
MSRHDRLLHILMLLRSPRPLSVARLAQECDVTPRTIYRDIDTISRANYPIYYDNGYRLLPTGSLPPPQFTPEEQGLLRAALDAWPLASTAAYRTTLRRIGAKLNAWQPGGRRQEGLAVRPRSDTDPGLDPRFMGVITCAIEESRALDLKYDSLSSGQSTRRVDPLFIVFRGHAYYLVAFCHKTHEHRLFRLGRIRALAVTSHTFKRDPTVSLERLFRHNWDVYLGAPFTATVRFTGSAARVVAGTRRHPSKHVASTSGGSLLYTVTVNSVEEFGRRILGFGGEARVVSPPALVRWVRRQARETLSAYRQPKS